ncbi:MAG: hypothetical protein AB8G17_13365 [Gammaproteobacteria bacterium]
MTNSASLNKILWPCVVLFVLTAAALIAIDVQLRNAATPHGIVSFELCTFASSCDRALDQWGAKGQALAMLSLGLDYLFLILYPGLIFIVLRLLAVHLPPNLRGPTALAAWSCPVIALADAAENFALIQVIVRQSGDFYGFVGGVFAVIKFVCLGLALTWLAIVFIKYLLNRG